MYCELFYSRQDSLDVSGPRPDSACCKENVWGNVLAQRVAETVKPFTQFGKYENKLGGWNFLHSLHCNLFISPAGPAPAAAY